MMSLRSPAEKEVIHNQPGLEVGAKPDAEGLHPVQPGLIPYRDINNEKEAWTCQQQEQYPTPIASEKVTRNADVCGFTRRQFVVLSCFGLFVLLALSLGLGLGLGLGLAASRAKGGSAALATTSGMETASTVLLSSSASTSGLSSASISASISSAAVVTTTIPSSASSMLATSTSTRTSSSTASSTLIRTCPTANNTLTTASGTTFRVYCNSDLHAPIKADLASNIQASFADCVALCAGMDYFQNRQDVSAVYNWAGTGTQTPGTCWCLAGTGAGDGAGVVSNPGNDAALIEA